VGIFTDQVVHLVPVIDVLNQQAIAMQLVEIPGGLAERQTGEGGGGVRVDVRA
jgi:ribosome-interacting GTPase 1